MSLFRSLPLNSINDTPGPLTDVSPPWQVDCLLKIRRLVFAFLILSRGGTSVLALQDFLVLEQPAHAICDMVHAVVDDNTSSPSTTHLPFSTKSSDWLSLRSPEALS